MQRFLVKGNVSIRKRPDRACEEWLNYRRGQVYSAAEFPKHAPLDEWVKSGHLAPIGDGAAPEGGEV